MLQGTSYKEHYHGTYCRRVRPLVEYTYNRGMGTASRILGDRPANFGDSFSLPLFSIYCLLILSLGPFAIFGPQAPLYKLSYILFWTQATVGGSPFGPFISMARGHSHE